MLAQLDGAKDSDAALMVKSCPVRALREVQEDGTDVFLGDIDIGPCIYGELMGGDVNWEEKERREKDNSSRKAGDVDAVWSVGCMSNP